MAILSPSGTRRLGRPVGHDLLQHDVFPNPAPRTRRGFPFVAVLQADIAEEGSRLVVAPMMQRSLVTGASGRLFPVVSLGRNEFLLAVSLLSVLPAAQLKEPVGSVAAYRDEITRALDWLFTGV